MQILKSIIFCLFIVCSTCSVFARTEYYQGGAIFSDPEGECECVEFYTFITSAEYPGGDEALVKYLHEKIKNSKHLVKDGWTGTVVVQFQIDPLGDVANVELVRSVLPFLDGPVVRAVKGMQKWSPQRQRSRAVMSGIMRVFVSFAIKDGYAHSTVRLWRKDIFSEEEKLFYESIKRDQEKADARCEEQLKSLKKEDSPASETEK